MINFKKKLEPNNSNGFTLLEVMIALAIFSIGILALANLQIQSTNQNSSARKYTDAVAAAQQQIELLMGVPFTNGGLVSGQPVDTVGNQLTNIVNLYTIQWNVTDRDLNGDGIVDYKEINLRVLDLINPAATPRFVTNFSRAIIFI
jgi:prepilin-type N-terminal cleavage/methylation domain-containing protein